MQRPAVDSRVRSASLRRFESGYTIVEVVLVIVILAVLGTVAGPRFFDNASFDERTYYDELVSALRYAQKVAVASGCRVQVQIAAASYSASQQTGSLGHCDAADTSYPTPVRLSSGDPLAGNAPAGTLTSPALTLIYTPLGSTDLLANQALVVGSRTLVVQADSGLVVTP
ncbi:MAG: GspH/FimT family pseudopilin [Woeseiaceae bacterium]|nr:GspH/FimT family pseudopilin [Woeseiaceae bacterium]